MTNSLQIWPVSPMPVLQREKMWGASTAKFQTGGEQSSTAWSRPLMRWTIPFVNVTSIDRFALYEFYDDMKADVGRFLMMDPDDYQINSAGILFSTANTFSIRTRKGFPVIPSSSHLSIVSVLSGELTNGIDYTLDQDTGIITYVLTPSAADSWSVQSTDFFRKCKFDGNYKDASPRVWSAYNINLGVQELPV